MPHTFVLQFPCTLRKIHMCILPEVLTLFLSGCILIRVFSYENYTTSSVSGASLNYHLVHTPLTLQI